LVDALGNPVDVMLTPGQAHDLTCAEPLLDEADPEALIGDKAYDADPLLATLAQRNITIVIPPKVNRKTKRTCDYALYCERQAPTAERTLDPGMFTESLNLDPELENWQGTVYFSTVDGQTRIIMGARTRLFSRNSCVRLGRGSNCHCRS
jgi:transposase